MYYPYFISLFLFISLIISIYSLLSDYNPLPIKFLSFFLFISILILSFFYPKNIFLPFLSQSVFPPSLIPNELYPPNSNLKINIDFFYPNGTKIIYWASIHDYHDNNKVFDNPNDAYKDFKNSGIAIVNNNKAILHINCPNQYKIPPFNNTLKKHIHYRIATPNNPILSDVKTIYINCN
jgi:hypothetical protein